MPWRKRYKVHDRSRTRKNLLSTLSPAQQGIVIELRRTLLLPRDDLLMMVREFIHMQLSRTAPDRCLRRNDVSRMADLTPVEPSDEVKTKPFKVYEPGFIHIEYKYLPQMPNEAQRRYLFVAIDRATRWVYVELKMNKTARLSRAFLKAVRAKTRFRSASCSPTTTRPSPICSRPKTVSPAQWCACLRQSLPRVRNRVATITGTPAADLRHG